MIAPDSCLMILIDHLYDLRHQPWIPMALFPSFRLPFTCIILKVLNNPSYRYHSMFKPCFILYPFAHPVPFFVMSELNEIADLLVRYSWLAQYCRSAAGGPLLLKSSRRLKMWCLNIFCQTPEAENRLQTASRKETLE